MCNQRDLLCDGIIDILQSQYVIVFGKYVKSEKCQKPFLEASSNDDIVSREKENECCHMFIKYQFNIKLSFIFQGT